MTNRNWAGRKETLVKQTKDYFIFSSDQGYRWQGKGVFSHLPAVVRVVQSCDEAEKAAAAAIYS